MCLLPKMLVNIHTLLRSLYGRNTNKRIQTPKAGKHAHALSKISKICDGVCHVPRSSTPERLKFERKSERKYMQSGGEHS